MPKKKPVPPPTLEELTEEVRNLHNCNLLLEESVRQKQRETDRANETVHYLRHKLNKTQRTLAVLISTHLNTLVTLHEGKALDIHDITGER